VESTAWSKDLAVEVAGHGVVSHAGSAAVRLIADGTGLTGALSRALARRGFSPVHDRGRVLADTVVLIADGGTVMSIWPRCATRVSCSARWPRIRHCGAPCTRSAPPSGNGSAGRAKVRRHVWGLIEARHGQIPPSQVADKDLGATVVIRMDASILISHSDKELAAGTFKHTYGHHPLTAWCDNTDESLAFRLRAGKCGLQHRLRSHRGARRGDRPDPRPTPPGPAGHRRRGRRHLGHGPSHHQAQCRTRAPGALLGGVRPRRARPDRHRPGAHEGLAGGV